MLPPAEMRRRLRAARALAAPSAAEIEERSRARKRVGDVEQGISTKELAARLGAEGERLGADTLSLMERGGREILPKDMRAIARACDLPYAFFTSDFWLLQALEEYWPDEEQALGNLADLSETQIIEAAFNALRRTDRPETIGPPDLNLEPDQVLEEIRSMWNAVVDLSELVADRAGIPPADVEGLLRGATRRTKQLLADREAETAQETEAAASTRDEEGANPGAARAPGAATPRTGRKTAP